VTDFISFAIVANPFGSFYAKLLTDRQTDKQRVLVTSHRTIGCSQDSDTIFWRAVRPVLLLLNKAMLVINSSPCVYKSTAYR